MPQVISNGMTLEYDTFGDASNPALLLIMGLGAQMIHWDEAFCQQLADKGHFVIRHDNRDVGLSTKLDDAPAVDMIELMTNLAQGKPPAVPYTLDDMANDSVGLLDALEIKQAHICGASMGGMIAQLVACNHPTRALSLTSIMSTTGNSEMPSATKEAQEALTAPRPDSLEESIERAISNARVIGSKGFELDVAKTTERAIQAFERSFYPIGVARQMAAIAANGDRRARLNKLDLPALVIHGTDDCLVPIEGGRDTHENIKNSKFLEVKGMGHDLPEGAWDDIIKAICELTASVEQAA